MLTGEAATEVECASARKKIGRLTGELVNWSVGQQVDRRFFKVNRFTCAMSYGQQVNIEAEKEVVSVNNLAIEGNL